VFLFGREENQESDAGDELLGGFFPEERSRELNDYVFLVWEIKNKVLTFSQPALN